MDLYFLTGWLPTVMSDAGVPVRTAILIFRFITASLLNAVFLGVAYRYMSGRNSRIALTVLAIALILTGAAWPESTATPRVVAVGDIHGDFDAFVAILQRASLLDTNRHWSGRDAVLVQTGDFLDRGPKTRAVMDLLMQLQKEAPRQNGRVMVLLGNHEAMNIYGDLRDVTDNDFSSYADAKSEARRKSAYEAYAASADSEPRLDRDDWMKSHPSGFIEHREAFSADGRYGKWLRTLPAVAKVQDSVFVHGGIHPQFVTWKIDRFNDAIASELRAFDAYRKYMVEEKIALPFYTLTELADAAGAALKDPNLKDPNRKKFLEGFLGFGGWISIHPDGPLWFRGFAQWSDEEGAPQISRLLSAFGIARFVVGHTPLQPGQIVPRFNGRVYLIDTGMLSSYFPGGRASALEIQDSGVTPLYIE